MLDTPYSLGSVRTGGSEAHQILSPSPRCGGFEIFSGETGLL